MELGRRRPMVPTCRGAGDGTDPPGRTKSNRPGPTATCTARMTNTLLTSNRAKKMELYKTKLGGAVMNGSGGVSPDVIFSAMLEKHRRDGLRS